MCCKLHVKQNNNNTKQKPKSLLENLKYPIHWDPLRRYGFLKPIIPFDHLALMLCL